MGVRGASPGTRTLDTRLKRAVLLPTELVTHMVPLTGVEPVRCRQRGILSPLCLPIPPQRHIKFEVLLTRLELVRTFIHYPLKVACLPIPPQQHVYLSLMVLL